MWLMVAIELTSLFMRRIPRRVWRYVHMTAFFSFAMSAAHGLQAGTDTSRGMVQIALLSTVMTVMFLTLVRILAERGARRRGVTKPASTDSMRVVA
jgi:DMSO/TMAO reductase YedYZ heme-binding membrane subunit